LPANSLSGALTSAPTRRIQPCKATAALAGNRSVADSVRESGKRTSLTRSKRLHGAFKRALHRCAGHLGATA
jgi:hypothetical protein